MRSLPERGHGAGGSQARTADRSHRRAGLRHRGGCRDGPLLRHPRARSIPDPWEGHWGGGDRARRRREPRPRGDRALRAEGAQVPSATPGHRAYEAAEGTSVDRRVQAVAGKGWAPADRAYPITHGWASETTHQKRVVLSPALRSRA